MTSNPGTFGLTQNHHPCSISSGKEIGLRMVAPMKRLRTVARMLPPRMFHQLLCLKNLKLSFIEREMEILHLFMSRDHDAIDVGAHLGIFSKFMAGRCRTYHAIEPIPELSAFLRKVLLANCRVYNYALSNFQGETTMRVPRDKAGDLRYGLSTIDESNDLDQKPFERFRVDVTKLDSLEAIGTNGISFIKIDVEGHEEEVVSGAMETIGQHKPALMIEIERRHHPGSFGAVRKRLSSIGYNGYFYANGSLVSVAKFDFDVHQQIKKIRSSSYIRNFLFLP